MKKKALFIPFLLTVINAYSQSGSKIKFGIKLGVALANAKMEYTDNSISRNFTTKTGLVAGCFSDILVSKTFIFQPALLYVRKGTRGSNLYYTDYPTKYNFLEIPLNVLCRYSRKKRNIFLGWRVVSCYSVE